MSLFRLLKSFQLVLSVGVHVMKLSVRLAFLLLFINLPLFAQGVQDRESVRQRYLVGYFPQWGTYGGYNVKNVITSGSAPLLTHLNYAFANVADNQCQSFDPWADYQNPLPADQTVNGRADSQDPNAFVGNFHQLQELKRRYPNLQIAISIGGGSADPSAFSTAALPQNRKAFVKSCIDMFIRGHFAPGLHEPGIFDGIDVDWEYPASDADKTNFTALLKEFREQLDRLRPGMPLTIAAPAGSWAYQFIDLAKVQHSLTFFNLMNYDFDGPWNYETGFVAPLYRSLKDPDAYNNADAAVQAYLDAGVESRKIVFGMPFYGYEWGDVPNIDNGLFEPGTPENWGDGYNYIVTIRKQYQMFRDSITQEPWLYDGYNFWTYDDPVSLAFKMDYVRKQRLGGAMFWELSSDTSDGVLIKTLAQGLRCDRDDDHN